MATTSGPAARGRRAARLCLNMIVKDEAAIIGRCLSSVADHVDAYVIGDTGSTDGTPEMIERFFAGRGIPGELHRFPFETFGQARNEALERARASALPGDYLLLVDADMELVVHDPAFRDGLAAPAYRMVQRAGVSYRNTRLIGRDTPGAYRGATHEHLDVRAAGVEDLDGASFIDHACGSNRSGKFERDIRLLLDAIAAAPDVARSTFYLAQSYRDAGRFEAAARAYAHRVELGGWDEEVWYSMLAEARCLLALGREAEFVGKALAAWDRRPHRAEPLRDVARHYRLRGLNQAAALVAEAGLDIPYPAGDALFIEDDVYDGGLAEDYAISAYHSASAARKDHGRRICDGLALSRRVPAERRDTARRNLGFYARPLAEVMDGVVHRRLDPALEPGWAAMNPSVALWRGALWMVQRTVNYALRDGAYATADGGPIATRNFLAGLDAALDIASWAEILADADRPVAYPHVLGYEDMRLIALGDALWCSSTLRHANPEGWCEQVLGRIGGAGGGGACRLADVRRISDPEPRRHEKNWTPLIADGELRFIRSYEGSTVVSRDGTAPMRRDGGPAADHLRGGSQAVPFAGGWLAVCHEVAVLGDRRRYLHRFAWFDGGTALARLSEPFKLSAEDVDFAAGLAHHPDGRSLVASYGVADRESWLAVLPAAGVARLLGLSPAEPRT